MVVAQELRQLLPKSQRTVEASPQAGSEVGRTGPTLPLDRKSLFVAEGNGMTLSDGRACPDGSCWSPTAQCWRSGRESVGEDLELRVPLVQSVSPHASRSSMSRVVDDDISGRQPSESSSSGPKGEQETVELSSNGYTLVLMTGNHIFLIMMVAVSIGQFGVLWLVAWSSPEYFFESGQWIVPVSEYWSVNAMKGFSLLLTLFRVTGEFKDATKLLRVLWDGERLEPPLSLRQRILGGSAFMLQYVVAVLVLFMAIHLILASTTPIGTIGKVWVVYIVLDFDNHLCTFLLFVREETLPTKVVVQHNPGHTNSKRVLHSYWAPVIMALAVVAFSMLRNVCPLTGLHYGIVRNDDPVLMLTSNFALPGACCPPQVTWDDNLAGEPDMPANVSVPCLSPGKEPPDVFWVVVPDGRPSPSSLQVMEGRGGDGNHGLRYGQVRTTALQMHWWLSLHGFAHLNVYDVMESRDAGGLGLYSSTFPYLAQWSITDFPWNARVRVFATAVNPATGALSPQPVQSAVILRKLCPAHCDQCGSTSGACWACEKGFTLVGKLCVACSAGCEVCKVAGAGSCDPGGCRIGYGLAPDGRSCLPCRGGRCTLCDAPQGGAVEQVDGLRQLNCTICDVGYGLAQSGSCTPCETSRCRSCPSLNRCEDCVDGYVLWSLTKNRTHDQPQEECKPCAAKCLQCQHLGPGHCDPERCESGYSLSPSGTCAPCSAQCLNCTKSGPGNCDPLQCKVGYGLQGNTRCNKCMVDRCDVCDNPSTCDKCAEGYGLTPQMTCEVCAESCKRCTEVGDCAECNPRFGLNAGKCFACADECAQCAVEGPGKCDEGHCLPGWTTEPVDGSFICVRDTRAQEWLADTG